MSNRPTPETDEIWNEWAKERHPNGVFKYGTADIAEHARRLERQRDAYAETLRIIATANDRSHHEAAFTSLIRNRHPELTP